MAKNNGNGKDNFGTLNSHGDITKVLIIGEKGKRELKEPYFSMFQEAIVGMSKLGLSGTTWSVFGYLSGKMDFENDVHVPQKYIAIGLNINQAEVSRAIKKLVFHGILLPGESIGTAKSYKLNCNICWKGRTRNLEKERLKLV